MFSLELYLRNSNNGSATQYTVKNLYFENFYLGRRRDINNLLIIRKIADGLILLKNPLDFAAVEDYLYSPQDAYLTIDSVLYQCLVKFTEPNFTTNQVKISLSIIDDYSRMLDGAIWDSWFQNQEPTISKLYKVNDFQLIPDTQFIDGSQYMYDAEIPGSELWGTETESFTESKDVHVADAILFDKGGDSQGGNALTIDMLIPKVEYLDAYYKPTFVKWSNSSGTHYQTVKVDYEREFRYFEESEKVPDRWEPVSGTLDKNGFTYNKYVRPLFGDQTYLTGENIYFIRDEWTSLDYSAAEFRGINTELQKSYKFYNVNTLLEQLIGSANFALTDYLTVVPSDYFVCILKNYNNNQISSDNFKLETFINFLRDKFRIYFEYNKDNFSAEFKYLDFSDKLLDIDDYRNTDFIPFIAVTLNQVPKIIDLTTEGWQLDFKSQKVSFYGKNNLKESKQYEISTDIENASKSEDALIMIKAKEDFHDQIFEQFIYIGSQNGTEALNRTKDGKFLTWDTSFLDLATYLEFDVYSNTIYLDINDDIQLSYDVVIYDGSVRVRIGSYDVTHSVTATVSVNTDSNGSSTDRLRINLNSGVGNYRGFIANITVKVKSKIPETKNGEVSGRSLKNGELSAANTIVNKKPLFSYPHGYLKNKSTIDCNTMYSKEINFKIALNLSLFAWDINKFWGLDSEEYIIFEEKRQALDVNTMSEYSIIKAKSNDII